MIKVLHDPDNPLSDELLNQALGAWNVDPSLRQRVIEDGDSKGALLARLAENPSLTESEVRVLLDLPLPREEKVEVLIGLVGNSRVSAIKGGIYSWEAYALLLGLYDVYGDHLKTPKGSFMPDPVVHKLTGAILSNEGLPASLLEHYAKVLEERALLKEKNLEILRVYAQDPTYGGNYERLKSETEESLALTAQAMRALAEHLGLGAERASELRRAAEEILERSGVSPLVHKGGEDLDL